MSTSATSHSIQEQLALLDDNSYAPYSGRSQSCLLILENGEWIPGVRIENASFPMTITAFQNAWATAIAVGRSDIFAVVFDQPVSDLEAGIIEGSIPYLKRNGAWSFSLTDEKLKDVIGNRVDVVRSADHFDRLALMHECKANLSNAFVPESDFPVSCVLRMENGEFVSSVNVESHYWPFTLCAERNALSTALAYGLSSPAEIYLSCAKDNQASPCGACRQVINELAPDSTVLMDRTESSIEEISPLALLPGPFLGHSLRK